MKVEHALQIPPCISDVKFSLLVKVSMHVHDINISFRYGLEEMISFLLDNGSDPNQPTKNGSTPIDLTRSTDIIRLLLKKGAIPTYGNMEKIFPEPLPKEPSDMAIKMFAVGNPGAGKSTLVKSIESEAEGFRSRLVSQLTKVKGVDAKTAGIIPHEIISKSLGRVILYDFAGQREYYAGHDALLRNSVGTSPSVVMVVVDVRGEEGKVRATVEYWLEFLAQQNYDGISRPYLLLIGSHVDKVSSSDAKSRLKLIQSSLNDRKLDNFVCAEPVLLDCRYAGRATMTKLRESLSQICQESRATQEKLNFANHSFLVFLLDKFRNDSAITVFSVQQVINDTVAQEFHWTFLQSLDLLSCCKELNKQGSILLMSNSDHPERSWIILDKAVLLSQVNGKLFAPEDFKEHQKIANSTGVVPLSKLAAVFPDLDQEMISQFLCHLEFCHEVTDPNVLSLLQAEATSSVEGERYFFFPSLVQLETPNDLWQRSSDFDHHTGWILECLKAEQFLTPRFLQVLLLRLAFQFALISSVVTASSIVIWRKCYVWKNGISWANQSGGEAIVEVVDQKKVVVMTRCDKRVKQPKLESVNLRSLIIQTVLSTKNELCRKVEMRESLIHPKDTVSYPIDITQAKCVSIKDVAHTVKDGKELVVLNNRERFHVEELLHFEPYANMEESLLRELFEDPSQHHQAISDEVINRIAKCAHVNIDDYCAVIEPLLRQVATSNASNGEVNKLSQVLRLWREEMGPDGTCCRLHRQLDQYSVFAGRSPLKIGQGTWPVISDHQHAHCNSLLQ